LMQEMIEDYFGSSGTLEKFVENGQLIQAEGYKAIYEEARRQKPLTGMAIARFFNESWPAAAGTSIISWPDIPKPAFYSVRDACRPALASARIKKLKWQEGELFEADLFFLNDRFSAIDQGRMVVTLVAGGRELTLLNWDHDRVKPNINLHGPTVRKILPKWDVDRFRLRLEVLGHPEYNAEYLLLYERSE
ncbi:MAG: hypothetical protein LC655_04995, partial [Bacteroidales bacterium]|nr:hypothetical protein [Bacteroidales bacterium]